MIYSSTQMCRRSFSEDFFFVIKSHLRASLELETLDSPMQRNMRVRLNNLLDFLVVGSYHDMVIGYKLLKCRIFTHA